MRILHIDYDDINNPHAGGGQANATREIYARLASRHKITVLTGNYPGARNELIDGIEYRRIGLGKFGAKISILSHWLLLPFVVYKLQKGYDLISEFFTAPFSVSLTPLIAKKPIISCPSFLNARELWKKYKIPFHWVEIYGIKKYQHFITLTEHGAKKVRKMNPRAIIQTIPRGVNSSFIKSVSEDGDYLLFLGRIDFYQKGLDILLECCKALRIKGIEFRLLIAGNGKSTEQKKLSKLISESNLSKYVQCVGRVSGDEKLDLIRKSKMVLFPSRFESFGQVILEASSCSKPIICFDIEDLSYLPARASMKIRPFDQIHFNQGVERLDKDKALRLVLGSNAREFARNFSWDTVAKSHERLYNSVVASYPKK